MSQPLSATPDGTVWAQKVLTARYPELESVSHGISYVFAAQAVSRLAADIDLRRMGVDTVEPVTTDQARAGLTLAEDAALGVRYAELLTAHTAYALGRGGQ
jgi:hypothetical protein